MGRWPAGSLLSQPSVLDCTAFSSLASPPLPAFSALSSLLPVPLCLASITTAFPCPAPGSFGVGVQPRRIFALSLSRVFSPVFRLPTVLPLPTLDSSQPGEGLGFSFPDPLAPLLRTPFLARHLCCVRFGSRRCRPSRFTHTTQEL